jgi:hypothetical protein
VIIVGFRDGLCDLLEGVSDLADEFVLLLDTLLDEVQALLGHIFRELRCPKHPAPTRNGSVTYIVVVFRHYKQIETRDIWKILI